METSTFCAVEKEQKENQVKVEHHLLGYYLHVGREKKNPTGQDEWRAYKTGSIEFWVSWLKIDSAEAQKRPSLLCFPLFKEEQVVVPETIRLAVKWC